MSAKTGKLVSNRFSKKRAPFELESDIEEEKIKKHTLWTLDEEMEFYIGIFSYCLQNPMYTLSWTEWKPPGYYPFLAKHMRDHFGPNAKNDDKCKTKDQNLKKKCFLKTNKPIDLMEHCFNQAQEILKHQKRTLKLKGTDNEESKRRLFRLRVVYEKCLKQCQLSHVPKPYELRARDLLNFSKTSPYMKSLKSTMAQLSRLAFQSQIFKEVVGFPPLK